MDIQANPTTDSVLTPSPKRRRFYRYGFFTLLFGCLFLGVFTLLVMTQARSRAQAEQFRTIAILRDSEQRSEWSEVPSRLSNPVGVPTPAMLPAPSGRDIFANRAVAPFANSLPKPANTGLAPSRMQPVTRMVQELQTIPFVDPVTGVKSLTQRVVLIPYTTMEHSNTMAPTSDPSMDFQPLEAEIQRLSERFRTAEISQRDSLSEALTRKLTGLFDARHKAQMSRVEAIRAEVQQTQELLSKRWLLKAQIVDRRLKELTGQRDELSWNPTVANALPSVVPRETIPGEMGNLPGEPLGLPDPTNYGEFRDSPRLMPSPNLTLPIEHPIPMPSNQEFRPTLGPISTPNDEPIVASTSRTAPGFDSIEIGPSAVLPSRNFPPNLPSLSLPPNPQPSALNPQPNITIPTTGEPTNNPPAITGTTSDPQRSFMSIGFKLKKLIKDLAELNANNLNANNLDLGASKAAINLQNAIDETRSVWDFEKSSLQLDLETTESEYGIVKNQLESTHQIAVAERARNAAGVTSNDLAKTELSILNIERQLLQIRSRLASFKKSLDWMEKFEDSVLKRSEPVLER